MNKEIKFPMLYSIAQIERKYYFKPVLSEGTYVYDEEKHEMSSIPELNRPYEWHSYIYSDSVVYKDKVVFIPYQEAEYISILDTARKEFSYIKNPGMYRYKKGEVYQDDIFMFGEKSEGSHCQVLNMSDGTVKEVSWKGTGFEPAISLRNTYRVSDFLICPNYGPNALVLFNLAEQIAKVVEVGNGDLTVDTITGRGESTIISGNNGEIIKWDLNTHLIMRELKLRKNEDKSPWNMFFSASEIMDNYVYFAPINYDYIIRIDLDNWEEEKLLKIREKEVCWSLFKLDEKRIYIDIVNYESGESRNCVCFSDGTVVENVEDFSLNGVFLPRTVNYESSESNLKMFLEFINR